jgi:membrane-bound serine protease (ClpP class)
MNRQRVVLFVFILILGLLWLPVDPPAVTGAETESRTPLAYVLSVDGSINPALSDYILKGIEEAKEQNASVIVIQMDTPGGVVTTTKTIIKAMIQCPIPVVVYVAPGGSSATSAGALITMGADIAAMAPGTNIGAAHPVGGGGQEINKTMSEKVMNDLTAYMRSVVARTGRNVKWVELAIRQSASVTAEKALELKVIDLMADSMPDLLNKIDGRKVKKQGKTVTLKTKGAVTKKFESGMRFKILDVVANPNIAYLLMMAGMLGLMIEFYNPGLIFPGVLGGICLLLALFASQVLPVNYVGVLLLILGVILFIMEVKIASFGLLSIAGIICLTLGSVMLYETGETAMRVSWTVIVPTVGLTSAFFILAMGLAARAWMAKPRTGEQGLIGEVGVASTELSREGKVYVHGEYWNARADSHIPQGERVRVIRIDNLYLVVTRDAAS